MQKVIRIAVAAALAGCAAAQRTADDKAPPAAEQRGVEVGDIDKSADPCVDFFQFANGKWRADNPIPASQQKWSRRWQAGEENKNKLRQILDELAGKRDWPKGSAEQLSADFYSSCTDEAANEAAGFAPIAALFREIDAAGDAAGVQRAIRALAAYGTAAPFTLAAGPDNHAPERTIVSLGASGLGLPDRDYYLKPDQRFEDARRSYRDYLARALKLAGIAPERADAIYAVEKRLAEASLDNVALRDPAQTDHRTTFAELQSLAPHFDWAAAFASAGVPEDALNVDQPKFLSDFDRMLSEVSVADWRDYLKWTVLSDFAPWLPKAFAGAWFDFYGKSLAGLKEWKPRNTRCAEAVDEQLGEAVGKKYVERYFPPAAKARMTELVQNELSAMREIISGLDWMGPETKQQALAKLATFRVKVGYPDKWRDYSGLSLERGPFLTSYLAARAFNAAFNRSLAGKPTDRDLWGMTPATSDAAYNPLMNDITFPAGILQPPAFDLRATDAVNYGAIGIVIGHEISHGFDDQGAQFDAQGRLRNWWTAEDLKRFQERGQCVVDQFESYFIEPGVHHNGKLVLGESIGDLAGGRIAYAAFQKALAAHPESARDGFSPDQEFFIAWGQFRGDETRPEAQRLMVQGDPHPVAKFRVIGPLSNQPAFQRAFQCPAGAPMVRPKPCQVW